MKRTLVSIVSMSSKISTALSATLESLDLGKETRLSFTNFALDDINFQSSEISDLVILNLPDWANTHAETVLEIRKQGHFGPILVLTSEVEGKMAAFGNAARYLKVGFLERPFDDRELKGCVRRLLGSRMANARMHVRHDINHTIRIASNDIYSEAVMTNISRGGASLEFPEHLALKLNGKISLEIQLNPGEEAVNVSARVAWIEEKKRTVGVEFLNGASYHLKLAL